MEDLNLAVRIVIYVALWSAAFVILWRLVLVFLSRLAGWPELKRLYAIGRDYAEPVWRSASGYLGPVWYAGTLTLGSSPSGLYIAAQFPFHFGSAPVLIPWTDIEVSRERKLFQTLTYFKFVGIPGLALRVSGKGADWILEVAGPNAKR